MFVSSQSNISELDKTDEPSNDDTIFEVQTETNEDDNVYLSASLPVPSETNSRCSRKRKIEKVSELLVENREARVKLMETLRNTTSNKEDDVDAFYKSVALSVKQLPPLLIAESKLQHLQTLQKIELKHMRDQQYQQPYYTQTLQPQINVSGQQYYQPQYYSQQQLIQMPVPRCPSTKTFQNLEPPTNQNYQPYQTLE